ncbi:vesicle-associated protein 1-1-like isoform X3 [Salvia splendens]|uniref:vesicle-associated protein 1-1-like isoform X3 n=1 Tax=Salvia splendens TaxID=180675 RepID=UPI001C25E020|nr:vesicle-associated protein 1-1-like isoform X3 [Salvia splendens]
MPLLRVQPRKMLVFCFERRGDRRASSTFRIWNDSPELIVAFKVKTTDRLKFSGSPIYGILMPRSHCDVDVTVHGQVEALFKIQHADNVIIKSLRASESDTVESIRSLFTEREDMVEDEKLSVAYAMHQKPSNFEIGIVVLLTCFAFLYFATLILSHIRALISLITILVVRVGLWMMKSKALDAAEEWIKSTLLYLSFCFLAAIKEYVLDLCWGWLKVIYKAFPGLCDSLYLYVFGPQVRGQRPRRRY